MNRRAGFSLVELMITLMVLAVVVAALMVVMIGSQRSKAATEGLVEAQQAGRSAVEFIARDVRSAGYGVDVNASPAQPAFAYVDSNEIVMYANLSPAAQRSSTEPSRSNPPLAPAVTGTLPAEVLTGSVYPAGFRLPMKWRTGAEMIRYTLDLNNDGVINAADQAVASASEATRSPNPNDFMLARIVYGDSSGAPPTAGNNGGAIENVGLVRGPGAGVPAMFTVYLGSNPGPWSWANGPIPASRLDEISRVTIRLTSESRRPNNKTGQYARTTITTEVNSIRNVPDAGLTTYTIDGYVFKDVNRDQVKGAGEPGIAEVVIRAGTAAVAQTNSLGYFILKVAPGMYSVKQEVPEGYGPLSPDSFLVNFLLSQSDVHHDFADTAKSGGWIIDTCWVDADGNGVRNAGEELIDHVSITVGATTRPTDGTGATSFFVAPGSWTVTATAPDSYFVSTPNPRAVSMVDGGTVHADFGLTKGGKGTVQGKVFRDSNKDGIFQSGEPAVAGVWVGVTKNSGTEVLSFGTTDASGNYTIDVPNNDPQHNTPYQVTLQVPTGYFPTSSTMIQPIWLDPGEVIVGQNFGLQSFQVITLSADRVLCLGSTELMEKDWTGNDDQYDAKSHKDQDLILGSEYVSNPNVSVWFNGWDQSLYTNTPSTFYQRNALASALCMAIGPIDNGTPATRPDIVTGLTTYTAGNFAVWITQNSSGNFGYLPTSPTYYKTQDQGDVNSVLLTTCDANASLDIVAGTKSAANSGTIEVWTNNGSGAFTRNEVYPPTGGIPGGNLGEVKAMAAADFDADGDSDLVVVTKTGPTSGRVHWFERVGNTSGTRWIHRTDHGLSGAGTSVCVLDVDGDGDRDVIVGTQTAVDKGKLEYWRNDTIALVFDFQNARTIDAVGIPLSLAAADFGGNPSRADLVVGHRDNETSYTGGLRVYFLDLGTLVALPSDPASGGANWMTPALSLDNFNFGANPTPSGTKLIDIGAAQKTGATTGQVLILVR